MSMHMSTKRRAVGGQDGRGRSRSLVRYGGSSAGAGM